MRVENLPIPAEAGGRAARGGEGGAGEETGEVDEVEAVGQVGDVQLKSEGAFFVAPEVGAEGSVEREGRQDAGAIKVHLGDYFGAVLGVEKCCRWQVRDVFGGEAAVVIGAPCGP